MLVEIVRTLSILQPRVDDDFVDRLSYYYTSTILVLMAFLVSFKMFGGRPMECWVPAEYSKPWEDYSEIYCWAQNTYWVPFEEGILPERIKQREERQVSYYQWTPFFLLISALMFYFPCILWRMLNDKSGIRLMDIVEVAADKFNIHAETRRNNLTGLSSHLLSILRHRLNMLNSRSVNMHRFARCFNCRYYEAYVALLYLFVKLLYLLNAVGQLMLMNKFLQTDGYRYYGIGVIRDLLSGVGWRESGNFPRVTLCDMQVRVMGQVQRHTVQCVLVINIFTEKMFILLWLWYTILSVTILMSFLYWAESCLFRRSRLRFIARNLELADINFDSKAREKDLETFLTNWIRIDGIFVLRMITIQAGAIFCMELIDRMWEEFLQLTAETKKASVNKFSERRKMTKGRRKLPPSGPVKSGPKPVPIPTINELPEDRENSSLPNDTRPLQDAPATGFRERKGTGPSKKPAQSSPISFIPTDLESGGSANPSGSAELQPSEDEADKTADEEGTSTFSNEKIVEEEEEEEGGEQKIGVLMPLVLGGRMLADPIRPLPQPKFGRNKFSRYTIR